MRFKWLAVVGLAIAALIAAACGSSTTASNSAGTASPAATPTHTAPAASGSTVKAGKAGGRAVLTNEKGLTLYWFAPDTSTASKCNGTCAESWPPVAGPATAGAGVTGKLGTIKRSGGATQATYADHPLYTFIADHAPGQANGNNVNAFGGLWHEVTVSGAVAPGASPASSSPGSGGY